MAFMKYADNRKLREELFRAYSSRCFHNNEKDNQEVIRKIVDYRFVWQICLDIKHMPIMFWRNAWRKLLKR